MRIKISEKNTKIGKIPNISLTPGLSCVSGIPCFNDGCYAFNAYRRYPATKAAWDSNLEFYRENPGEFFQEFHDWLHENKPERFRVFVGGDFPDEKFYHTLRGIALLNHRTKFLVFTKRYGYDFSQKPYNLQVVLSTWPGVPLPTNHNLPWSWLEEDPRKPEEYFRCPGGCEECGHHCWDRRDTHIVFPRH